MGYWKMPSKWARFAHRVWDNPDTGDALADAQAGIDALRSFVADVLGLPLTLSEMGITDAHDKAAGFAASIDIDAWNETPGYCVSFDEDKVRAFFDAVCS